jgi:leucine dehydrogenase
VQEGLIERSIAAWGGEMLITHRDGLTGAWMVVAIHSTRLGPAAGGTRMKAYPSLADAIGDALRLSEGMTLKFAVADFPRGGGKSVIAVPHDLDDGARTGLLERYGTLIHRLGGLYETGPDVGTAPSDMDIIARTGAPYVHCRTAAAGGAGDSAPATATGTLEAIRVTLAQRSGSPSLAGRRIVVQGAGSVGRLLIRHLLEAGADVAFTDINPDAVRLVRESLGARPLSPDAVFDEPCDLFSPCALGGVLSESTIPRLRCAAVAGCANNQLATPADAERLRERDILYAPDFVVSLGGAVAITGIEALDWPPEDATSRVVHIVSGALRRVFDGAQAEGTTTTEAARRLAEERLGERAGALSP